MIKGNFVIVIFSMLVLNANANTCRSFFDHPYICGEKENAHTKISNDGTVYIECNDGLLNILCAYYGLDFSNPPFYKICFYDNTFKEISQECNSKKYCSITRGLLDNDPCLGYKKYIRVDYECVKKYPLLNLYCSDRTVCPAITQAAEQIVITTQTSIRCDDHKIIKINCAFYGISKELPCTMKTWNPFPSTCYDKDSFDQIYDLCNNKKKCEINDFAMFSEVCRTYDFNILKYSKFCNKLYVQYSCFLPEAHKIEIIVECNKISNYNNDVKCIFLLLTGNIDIPEIKQNYIISLNNETESFRLNYFNITSRQEIKSLNDSFDKILLLKNRVFSTGLLTEFEINALESSRVKIQIIKLLYCDTKSICNIDWLLENGYNNYTIEYESNEIDVQPNLNIFNASKIGFEDVYLDINLIPMIICLNKSCKIKEISSNISFYKDIYVENQTAEYFKIINFNHSTVFLANMVLDYKYFYDFKIIRNFNSVNLTVEVQNSGPSNINYSITFTYEHIFRNFSDINFFKVEPYYENYSNFTFMNQTNDTSQVSDYYTTDFEKSSVPSLNPTTIHKTLKSSTRRHIIYNETDFQNLEEEVLIDLLKEETFDIVGCLVNCSNHGSCNYDSKKKSYHCFCYDKFTGDNCQINLDPCYKTQCLNSGQCVSLEDQEFFCLCSNTTYGQRCENQIDFCMNQTCSNKGTCHVINYKPTCKCYDSFFGEECEKETNGYKVVKGLRQTSFIIAIALIVLVYFTFIFIDITNSFGATDQKLKEKRRNQQRKENQVIIIKRHVYVS